MQAASSSDAATPLTRSMSSRTTKRAFGKWVSSWVRVFGGKRLLRIAGQNDVGSQALRGDAARPAVT